MFLFSTVSWLNSDNPITVDSASQRSTKFKSIGVVVPAEPARITKAMSRANSQHCLTLSQLRLRSEAEQSRLVQGNTSFYPTRRQPRMFSRRFSLMDGVTVRGRALSLVMTDELDEAFA